MADFIAINNQVSTQKIIGHEIHTSRSSWIKELKFFKMNDDVDHDLSRSSLVKKFCHHWFLVVSNPDIVKDGELPEDWGMMVIKNNQLMTVKNAPALIAHPITLDFSTCLLDSSIQTANRGPYFRDADYAPKSRPWVPVGSVPSGVYVESCVACGHARPCRVHQPRDFARHNKSN